MNSTQLILTMLECIYAILHFHKERNSFQKNVDLIYNIGNYVKVHKMTKQTLKASQCLRHSQAVIRGNQGQSKQHLLREAKLKEASVCLLEAAILPCGPCLFFFHSEHVCRCHIPQNYLSPPFLLTFTEYVQICLVSQLGSQVAYKWDY